MKQAKPKQKFTEEVNVQQSFETYEARLNRREKQEKEVEIGRGSNLAWKRFLQM